MWYGTNLNPTNTAILGFILLLGICPMRKNGAGRDSFSLKRWLRKGLRHP